MKCLTNQERDKNDELYKDYELTILMKSTFQAYHMMGVLDYTLQKRDGYFNLAKVISVAAE